MQKSSKPRWRLAAILSVVMMLVLISGVMVVEQLLRVVNNVPSTSMDIVPVTLAASDKTAAVTADNIKLESNKLDTDKQDVSAEGQADSAEASTEAYQPGLEVRDENNVVWETDTQVEIFHAVYENASGEVTVRSAGNDKVIAPGTSNVYDFNINNTGNVALDYTLSSEAEITFQSGGKPYTVPIVVRFVDWNGNYVVGSSTSWQPVEALDGFSTKGSLTARHYAKYSLEWQWPFEGDDTLDTLLGNLAASGDEIRVTIKLIVYATDALDPDVIGGIPMTGDNANMVLWIALFVCSAFMIPLLLVLGRRKKEDEE